MDIAKQPRRRTSPRHGHAPPEVQHPATPEPYPLLEPLARALLHVAAFSDSHHPATGTGLRPSVKGVAWLVVVSRETRGPGAGAPPGQRRRAVCFEGCRACNPAGPLGRAVTRRHVACQAKHTPRQQPQLASASATDLLRTRGAASHGAVYRLGALRSRHAPLTAFTHTHHPHPCAYRPQSSTVLSRWPRSWACRWPP